MIHINKYFKFITLVALFIVTCTSCVDDLSDQTILTSDKMTLVQTLESSPDEFSIYVEILKKTGLYTALQSYGSYTCFVPTNDVWKEYMLERWGITSIADFPEDQIADLDELVKFHTMSKSRGSSSFDEGRMTDTTYTGDFLTSSYLGGGGAADLLINKEAKFLRYDISSTNGMIHSIDHVLTPYSNPVPVVMDLAGKHTIFVEAMKQTGLYDQFSAYKDENGAKINFTIFAESDSIFAKYDINSYADLLARYSDTTGVAPTDAAHELNRFIAYHAVQTFMYTGDMPEDGFLATILANNAIQVAIDGRYIQINPKTRNGKYVWTDLVMDYSNLPAKNGVYHTVDSILDISIPDAKHVFFDPVNEQPEYTSKTIVTMDKVLPSAYQYVDWYPSTLVQRFTVKSSAINLNWSFFDIGNFVWFEVITSVLPKGKYEMLICANGGNSARGVFQLYWDGEPIGSVYDVRTKGANIGFPDSAEMEANSWRRGLTSVANKSGDLQSDSQSTMRYIVTKELLCPTQGQHTLRLVTVKSGGVPFDYVEFIPVIE